MPRRRGGGAEAESLSRQGLDELIAAAGPLEPPADLGNFRPDASPQAPSRLERPSSEEPAPEESAPEPPAPPSLPEDDDDGDGIDPRVQEQLDALRRENDFLRLGQRSAAPAAEPQGQPQDLNGQLNNLLQGWGVTPEDIEVFRSGDPNRAAEYVMNIIKVAAGAGAGLALRQARSEYQQAETQKTAATSLRGLMYGKHPGLEKYADLVMTHAGRVAQQMGLAQDRGMQPHEAERLVDETAKSVRAQLSQWGIQDAEARPKKVTRLRPAFAEGGSPGRSRGVGGLSDFDKQVLQLMNVR